MLAFLSAGGILFTRISSRDLRACAWNAYCARSLRARSVTVEARQLTTIRVHEVAVEY